MKIGIEGTPLCFSHHCGVKHYSENLLKELSLRDKKNNFFIFVPKKYSGITAKNFHFIVYPTWLPFFKRQIALPFLVKKHKPDVFHYLDPYGSILLNQPKTVTTIHDVNLDLTYPKFRSFKYFLTRYYCAIARYFTLKKTKHLIFVSKTIRKEFNSTLSGLSQVAGEDVIYEGVAKTFDSPKRIIKGLKYFMAMADFSPRKNIKKVLEAYARLPLYLRNKYKIKVVASTPEAAKYLVKEALFFKIASALKILVNVKNKDLASLYKNADVFIYPSLYEGFGLPILEAMASGCPVITSNYGAMREVAGNSALLVNPNSTSEIANAMVKLTTSRKIQKRLRISGIKRAKEFAWTKTAIATLAVYEKLYNQ